MTEQISIHALREEGDLAFHVINNAFFDFYPRPPRGGRRRAPRGLFHLQRHFYPRPPRGGRLNANIANGFAGVFLSTPSARRATTVVVRAIGARNDFYPRPPRGGRRSCTLTPITPARFLSTPSARRATCDDHCNAFQLCNFYPRPPRGGRRRPAADTPYGAVFLSTPSARRATHHVQPVSPLCRNFYPRPPRGGRPSVCPASPKTSSYFYPRPPRGGRLKAPWQTWCDMGISIHALREEGDEYIRSIEMFGQVFLSTPSARRATPYRAAGVQGFIISIHALREEGDPF